MAEPKRPALWSSEAVADISRIWDYYVGVAGFGTAAKLLREIGTLINLIEEHPFVGRSREEVRADLRSLSADPNVIFYRVADGIPEIIRILDGRQDIGEIFSDSETVTPPG
jgi:toxin ParE1/3/4